MRGDDDDDDDLVPVMVCRWGSVDCHPRWVGRCSARFCFGTNGPMNAPKHYLGPRTHAKRVEGKHSPRDVPSRIGRRASPVTTLTESADYVGRRALARGYIALLHVPSVFHRVRVLIRLKARGRLRRKNTKEGSVQQSIPSIPSIQPPVACGVYSTGHTWHLNG